MYIYNTHNISDRLNISRNTARYLIVKYLVYKTEYIRIKEKRTYRLYITIEAFEKLTTIIKTKVKVGVGGSRKYREAIVPDKEVLASELKGMLFSYSFNQYEDSSEGYYNILESKYGFTSEEIGRLKEVKERRKEVNLKSNKI